MFALMFALARMASAAWVGAAVLFVIVAVDQTLYVKDSSDFFLEKVEAEPPAPTSGEGATPQSAETPSTVLKSVSVDKNTRTRLNAQFAARRFRLYYYTGGALIGLAWISSLFLRRRYLKASRWMLVMVFLSGAAGMIAYDWLKVYRPLQGWNLTIMDKPEVVDDTRFQTLHEHSRMVNGAQVLLTLMASLLLCLPGTRPDQPTMLMKRVREED